jgi:hypothetical protein
MHKVKRNGKIHAEQQSSGTAWRPTLDGEPMEQTRTEKHPLYFTMIVSAVIMK